MLSALTRKREEEAPLIEGEGAPAPAGRNAKAEPRPDLRIVRAGDPEPFRIVVREGGTIMFDQAFPPGEVLIGASPECDIVIVDAPEPEMVSIRLEPVGASFLATVAALAPGIVARGRKLAVGRPLAFPDGGKFSIGETYDFEIAFGGARAPLAAPGSLPILLLAGGVFLAATAWLIGQPLPRPPAPAQQASAPGVAAPPPTVSGPSAPAARAVPPGIPADLRGTSADTSNESRALALADLEAQLVRLSLVPSIRVRLDGGTLVAEGAVSAAERLRAVDAFNTFRARNDVPLEIALQSEPPQAPFFAIVFMEPEPLGIGADGRRYRPGERLPDGGVIASIDETSILVNRYGLNERIYYTR